MWEEELHVTCLNASSIVFGQNLDSSVASVRICSWYDYSPNWYREYRASSSRVLVYVSGQYGDLSLWHFGISSTEDVTLALPLVQAHVKASWNQARDWTCMATHYGEWSTWPLKTGKWNYHVRRSSVFNKTNQSVNAGAPYSVQQPDFYACFQISFRNLSQVRLANHTATRLPLP